MGTQNVVYTSSGTLFNLKNTGNSDTCYNMMGLEDMLREISQSQQDKYCIISLIYGPSGNDIYRDRK